MSQNYGECRQCCGSGLFTLASNGQKTECGRCGGTGFSGDGNDYVEAQLKIDREREQRAQMPHYSLAESREWTLREESRFYKNANKTLAMEMAIATITRLTKGTKDGV